MALTDKLTAIADAIRGKTGTSDKLTLDAMPTAISNIETGGGGSGDSPFTTEDFTFTGSLANFNAGGGMDGLLTKAKNEKLLSFKDITDLDTAFRYSSFDFGDMSIPLAGEKVSATGNSNGFGTPFRYYQGKALPKLTGKWAPVSGMKQSWFGDLPYIKNFDGVFDDVDWSLLDSNMTNATYNCVRDICYQNNRMRKAIPSSVLKHFDSTNTWGNIALYPFDYCYALDEVTDFPVFNNKFYRMQMSLRNCARLKRFTFETNPDGSPIVVTDWQYNSVIDFTTAGSGSGYSGYVDNPKVIYTDADYALYKDDPNACPIYQAHNRYNHDSAVETINSLPDASAVTGYTHTIKFLGNAGSATDGGAINTLTEAEIAVATAKGWTVTLS